MQIVNKKEIWYMSNGYDPWITIKKMAIVMAFGAIVGACEAGVAFCRVIISHQNM